MHRDLLWSSTFLWIFITFVCVAWILICRNSRWNGSRQQKREYEAAVTYNKLTRQQLNSREHTCFSSYCTSFSLAGNILDCNHLVSVSWDKVGNIFLGWEYMLILCMCLYWKFFCIWEQHTTHHMLDCHWSQPKARHCTVYVLRLFQVGISGAANAYTKEMEHWTLHGWGPYDHHYHPYIKDGNNNDDV